MAKHNTNQLKRISNNDEQDILNHSALNNNLLFLQVKGQNQLLKELLETEKIEDKLVDNGAIHRNEITNEVEGKYKNSPKKKIKIPLTQEKKIGKEN